MSYWTLLTCLLTTTAVAQEITVSRVGLAGARISDGATTIYIDGLAQGGPKGTVTDATVIFTTHDDLDHFEPRQAAAARASDAVVVGPPTITHPLLVAKQLPAAQVMPVYSPLANKPDTGWHEINGVRFRFWPSVPANKLCSGLG